ncbi:hypothetical protein Zmor_020124 [Zophobas morio]|uniref:Flavin-containing monooxygenase n=1 Tax=Zophobas morio TaxID=2755281 RepID=A0AA38I4T4_9CUCU|nr:hypothetical protein Zmor_020124 [Zophobas morio]
MKIAILGAGGAGLCAARHCLDENFNIDIFEQTGNVGGTWNYTDNIGVDENGIPVHSSMYQGLRTNLPKELMTYEDFPYPQQEKSYLPQDEVLDYIRNYAKKYHLEKYVKFYKQVLNVEPRDNLWLVEFEDVKNKQKESGFYDAVFVCNGHYKDAFIPEIPGQDSFKGTIKHSHDYRTPDCYKNRRVLLIGAGPSGCDISEHIAEVASKVYLSHKTHIFLPLSETIQQKPVVTKLEPSGAIFEDDTSEEVDDILYCTGYKFTFPFLSDTCGVQVKDNYVNPLFKQVISIENPTLGFIGIPFTVCPFPLFDIQVRFFLSTLNGHYKLPSKEEMLKDLEQTMAKMSGKPIRKYHQLGEDQKNYFDELAEAANIRKVPPVIQSLYMRVRKNRNLNDCFRIIDDEKWEQIR